MKSIFLDTFIKANKEILADGRIKMTGYRSNGQTLIIVYRDFGFIDEVEVYKTNCVGSRSVQATVDNDGRLAVKRGDEHVTTISVNEFIWQFDRLYRGLPLVLTGEYNHFARISQRDEEFGVNAGDVCTDEQNDAHKMLTNKIYEDTGLVCRVPSYGAAYAMLGQQKIHPQMVKYYEMLGDLSILTDRLK